MAGKPRVVVVGLGGNDGLRGLELKASEENLRQIVRKSKDAGASVLLLGMLMPPNYGPQYTGEFERAFAEVAKRHGAALLPFLFEDFGGDWRDFFQLDGIHPTEAAQPVMLESVWKRLRPLLR